MNLQPFGYQPNALPIELYFHFLVETMGIEPITRNLQGFVATLVHAPPYNFFGGNSGTRTCDLSLIRGVLYQLSYISIYIVQRRYKNRTCLFLFQRKCILQYTSPPKNDIWWRIWDSNPSDSFGASEVSTPSRPNPHIVWWKQ